ncbi:MAG: hypothetical protein PVI75_00715 [Gammaproteobacteria bacterium]
MKTSNKFILGILIFVFVILAILAVIFKAHLRPFNLIDKNDTGTATVAKKL